MWSCCCVRLYLPIHLRYCSTYVPPRPAPASVAEVAASATRERGRAEGCFSIPFLALILSFCFCFVASPIPLDASHSARCLRGRPHWPSRSLGAPRRRRSPPRSSARTWWRAFVVQARWIRLGGGGEVRFRVLPGPGHACCCSLEPRPILGLLGPWAALGRSCMTGAAAPAH